MNAPEPRRLLPTDRLAYSAIASLSFFANSSR